MPAVLLSTYREFEPNAARVKPINLLNEVLIERADALGTTGHERGIYVRKWCKPSTEKRAVPDGANNAAAFAVMTGVFMLLLLYTPVLAAIPLLAQLKP